MVDSVSLFPQSGTSLQRTRASKTAAWTDNWKQAHGEEHMLAGYHSDGLNQYRHILQFDFGTVFNNMATLRKAELHVFTAGDHEGFTTKTGFPNSEVNLITGYHTKPWAEAGGGETVWTGSMPDGASEMGGDYRSYYRVFATNLHESVINVRPLVMAWAPKTVKDYYSKTAGLAKANYGLILSVAGATLAKMQAHSVALASENHSNAALKPFLVLEFDQKGGPGVTVLVAPDGDIVRGLPQFFTGEWEPGRPGDKMANLEIKVSATGEPTQTWQQKPTSNDIATSTFSVAVPVSLKSGTTYDWTVRVQNATDSTWTPFPAPAQVRWTTSQGTLTLPQPSGTHTTLDSVPFTALYTRNGTSLSPVSEWQIQLRTQLVSTDPTWEQDLLWDTGWLVVPRPTGATPVTKSLTTPYGGPSLPVGTYSFRMKARDAVGATTAWLYGQVELLAQYIPQPGDLINLSKYGAPPPFRIRIYAMDLANRRKPGALLAELTDAANVGASEFYNSAGEFYFTLPATHPQAPVIEPYQCHYELQMHTGEGWRGKAFGIITDFDATEDEVVFYGQDYMAVLGRMVEERFSPVDAELPTDKGGAKYVEQTIKSIVVDQLSKEYAKANSPLGFISTSSADIADMPEKATIYASFKQRLPFISGLIDSSRAGTGRATRLLPERDVNGAWKWRVLYNPGIARGNLRMEYGGLVQGFRTVPFSAWGTAVDAAGRTVLGTKVYSDRKVAPGISEATYGAWPTTTMYSDLDDLNDIRRRTAQAAARVAKVGKMMGIGLRVDGLTVKDGWDITDHVPIDIKRGVVDTSRFGPDVNGQSWWTIWGWTWSSYPDGHTTLVLSLAPREDSLPPNPDLIPSEPILDIPEWQLDDVPPTTDDDGTYWMDTTTGDVYQKQDDGTWLMVASMMGPPGPEGPVGPEGPEGPPGSGTADTIPPPVPDIIEPVTSTNVQQQDGTAVTAIAVPVGYISTPVGLTDLSEYVLQSTRFPLASDPNVPDWELATQWNVVAPDATGAADTIIAQPSVLAATNYWLRVVAVDFSGNVSAPSAVVLHTTADDVEGPPQPSGIVVQPGMSVFGVRWDQNTAPDLAYVEVQWRVASPVGAWVAARVGGTITVITGVTNEVAYNVRLRSVDTSGNTLSSSGTSYRVSDSPEEGWVTAGPVTPTAIPGNALVWDAAMIEEVFAGNINADWITAGTLRVGGGAGNAAAITVLDSSGNELGRWSEDGIEIKDPDNDQYKMVLNEDGLTIWAGVGTPDEYEAVRLTPVGIDAASVTFGSARGGHNLVQNSSFELGAFGTSAVVANVWDLTADFTATRLGSDTNITISGGTTLGMTAI